MPTHLCSTCLGIPLQHAEYILVDLFSKSPSRTQCPHSNGTEGIILDSEISLSIAESLLDCYQIDAFGKDLHTCLREDFRFFSDIPNRNMHENIINSLLGSDSSENYRLKEELNFKRMIEEFHDELKTSHRFFFDKHGRYSFIFETLDLLIDSAKPSSTYFDFDSGANTLYRARLGSRVDKDGSHTPFCIEDMGAAPSQFCKGGRINPPGISFLYVASSEETAALEIRATPADFFTIVDVALQNDPLLLDLRKASVATLFGFKYFPHPQWIAKHLHKVSVFTYLSEILAQPVASEDPLGYIHTQIFCEYFKIKHVHGLIYDSTLCSAGFNVCIFEPSEFSELIGSPRLSRVSALSAEVQSLDV